MFFRSCLSKSPNLAKAPVGSVLNSNGLCRAKPFSVLAQSPIAIASMRQADDCWNRTSKRGLSFKKFTQKFKLKEDPPGNIVGTVNDAYVAPESDYFHGSYHWTYDRFVTIALLPTTVAPFTSSALDFPLLDAGLCGLLLVHCYTGFQSCIIDYIPKRKYGIWHTFAMRLLFFGSMVASFGIYKLETESNGLVSLCVDLWKSLDGPKDDF